MESKFEYKKRVVDDELSLQLEAAGMVLVEGPKWCGKTTTSLQQAQSVIYLDNPQEAIEYARLAEMDVQQLLNGQSPRLLDEWQNFPQLWDACRFVVDRSNKDGLFILTGSTRLKKKGLVSHTGTGRVGRIKMRPMSLWESGESSGEVSLGQLFNGPFKSASAMQRSLSEICYLVCRGGWPKAIGKSERTTLKQAYNYVDALATTDINDVDDVSRSEANTRRLLRSYARLQGSQAPISTIIADMKANDDNTLSDTTIASYLNALRALFVIEDMAAWNPNLRSKASIRTSDTRYFVDPSIAAAALGIGPADLMKDINTLGFLFETMAVRDLRVYAEANDGQVFHYRDSNNLECDTIIHLRNGHYALVEIKLGGETLINEGAKNLLLLEKKIDTSKMNALSFKMIITAVGQYAYCREDGIYVVPLTSLRP